MTAVMPTGTPSQTTDYVYGVTSSTGSNIFSNDLLAKVEYPNATTGTASTAASDDVTYTYDAVGDTTSMTDQNGNVHDYAYDVLGRQTLDSVATLGSGVDGSVRAIGTTFNAQGLPATETSYASSSGTGTIVNQDQDVYNGLGQLTGEYQSVSGAVNTSTTPEVQYGYSDPDTGSVQTSMTYPNGRVIDYIYNSGLDASIGRVSAIVDAGGSDAGTLQSYSYQGVGTIVGEGDGNGVTETTTLDQFGRTVELKYANSSGTITDDFQYGYDRDDNVLYQNNVLNSSQSQLYHANSTTSGDDNSAYDPLNRLTGFEQGTLSASGNNGSTLDAVSSPSSSQSWNLNTVGDQSSVTTNGTTTTNATNAKNELTGNGSNSLTYDNNGNTLTDENGLTYTYDAWNRQVSATSAGTLIACYSYDPTGRRITETTGGATTSVYFTSSWQDIEERKGSTVTKQNVWGLAYVNQLVERDDNSTTGNLGITGSGLGERLYAQQDINWSVTSLVDNSGNVVERMSYQPYGAVTFLTASWSPTSDAYAQNVLFQGGHFEAATGNYVFDHRDYDPVTGTWSEQDPDSYINGPNRYQMEISGPIGEDDQTGLSIKDDDEDEGAIERLLKDLMPSTERCPPPNRAPNSEIDPAHRNEDLHNARNQDGKIVENTDKDDQRLRQADQKQGKQAQDRQNGIRPVDDDDDDDGEDGGGGEGGGGVPPPTPQPPAPPAPKPPTPPNSPESPFQQSNGSSQGSQYNWIVGGGGDSSIDPGAFNLPNVPPPLPPLNAPSLWDWLTTPAGSGNSTDAFGRPFNNIDGAPVETPDAPVFFDTP